MNLPQIWWDDTAKKYKITKSLAEKFEKAKDTYRKNKELFNRVKHDNNNIL